MYAKWYSRFDDQSEIMNSIHAYISLSCNAWMVNKIAVGAVLKCSVRVEDKFLVLYIIVKLVK